MSVKLRLTRMGARHRPFFRIVVADSRNQRDGRAIDTLGFYDPMKEPHEIKVDEERTLEWLSKGATPTVNVASLLRKVGVLQKHNLSKAPVKPKPGSGDSPPAA